MRRSLHWELSSVPWSSGCRWTWPSLCPCSFASTSSAGTRLEILNLGTGTLVKNTYGPTLKVLESYPAKWMQRCGTLKTKMQSYESTCRNLTSRCTNSPLDAGTSLVDLELTCRCTNSPQMQKRYMQIENSLADAWTRPSCRNVICRSRNSFADVWTRRICRNVM